MMKIQSIYDSNQTHGKIKFLKLIIVINKLQ